MYKKILGLALSSSILVGLTSCGSNNDVITASSDLTTRQFTHWYTAFELKAIHECTDIFSTYLTSANLNPENNSYAENKYITENFAKKNDYCYDLYEHNHGDLSVLRSIYFRLHHDDPQAYAYAMKAVEYKRPNANINMAQYHLKMREYKSAIKWFIESYNENQNSNSAYEIGYIYDRYLRNYNSAITWYKIAYAQNQVIASYDLGVIYDSQLKDYKQGIYWYRKAKDFGYKGMNFKIATAYRNAQEYDMAYRYYERSHNIDHNPQASIELARMYGHDIKNYRKSARWYIEAYEKYHDKKLLIIIGDIYNKKLKHYDYATKWYIKAIDERQTNAIMKLADLYKDDLHDYQNAIKYYKVAVALLNNQTDAPNIIGNIYANNLRQYEKAVPWYEISARAGNAISGYNLGYLYEHKFKDYKKAKIWYEKSALLKNKKSAQALATIYRDIDKDFNHAEEWFSKADALVDTTPPTKK